MESKRCVLCGCRFNEWGNDPWPLKEEGWCCDRCNATKVIPARIAQVEKDETLPAVGLEKYLPLR